MTASICGVKWCDEVAEHRMPHRHYVGEAKVHQPHTAHFVSVAVVSTTRVPAGVEVVAGTAASTFSDVLLSWGQAEQLADLLTSARRYATG